MMAALVFSQAMFLQRLMGEEEIARSILGQFIGELPALLRAIHAGSATRNFELVKQHAHRLKGAASNVGGDALSEAARELEQASKVCDLARMDRWIADLETQAGLFEEAVRKMLG